MSCWPTESINPFNNWMDPTSEGARHCLYCTVAIFLMIFMVSGRSLSHYCIKDLLEIDKKNKKSKED
jgi:hypothetical protein